MVKLKQMPVVAWLMYCENSESGRERQEAVAVQKDARMWQKEIGSGER